MSLTPEPVMVNSNTFRHSAQTVIEVFHDEFQEHLTFSRDGVVALNSYIESVRPLLTDETRENAITMLGAFLGECLIATRGGDWDNQEGYWQIMIAEGLWACPFVQIRTQLELGLEHSVVGYFDCLIALSRTLESPILKQFEVSSTPEKNEFNRLSA